MIGVIGLHNINETSNSEHLRTVPNSSKRGRSELGCGGGKVGRRGGGILCTWKCNGIIQ